MLSRFKKFIIFPVLILLLVPIVFPIFRPYVAGTADGIGHRFRLVSFYTNLKEGYIRPRLAKEAALGFGAPIFIYNYPLPYYIASLFIFMGFDINQSGQMLSFTALILSFFFMFAVGKKLCGVWGGLLAGAFYAYAPYHLQLIYLYDSWGEQAAFIFPPLILLLMLQVIGKSKKGNKPSFFFTDIREIFLCLSFTLLILSHNLSAVVFCPLLLLMGLIIAGFRWIYFYPVFRTFLVSFLVSSYFFLPAFFLQSYINYPAFMQSERQFNFFKPFSEQLNTSFRVISQGVTHYLDFTSGLPLMFLSIFLMVYIFIFIFQKKGKGIQKNGSLNNRRLFLFQLAGEIKYVPSIINFLVFCSLSLLIFMYLISPISKWIWGYFPFNYFIYPFRLLFPATFLGSLLTAFLFSKNRLFAILFLILIMVQGLPYANPYADIFPFPNDYFYRVQTIRYAPIVKKNTLLQEFLPITARVENLENEDHYYWSAISDKIPYPSPVNAQNSIKESQVLENKSEKLVFKINLSNETEITINRFYFPLWELTSEGVKIAIKNDGTGRVKFSLDKGLHEVQLKLAISGWEKVGYCTSLIGVMIILRGIILNIKKKWQK